MILSLLTLFIVFLSLVHLLNFSNHSWEILNFMTNRFTTKTNRTCTREFLRNMSWSSAIITQCQSSLSFKRSPTFPILCVGITLLYLQSTKNLSRFMHPLISPKIISMQRNNISFSISIKFVQINSFFYLCPNIQIRKQSIKHT
jgi:hypothetical protein